jgi:hypothetical protein
VRTYSMCDQCALRPRTKFEQLSRRDQRSKSVDVRCSMFDVSVDVDGQGGWREEGPRARAALASFVLVTS